MPGASWARQVLRRRSLLADALLALALYLVGILLWPAGPRELWPGFSPAALAWSALGMATVVIRRRWLWPAVVLLAVHTTVPYLGFAHLATDALALLVLTYTVAERLSARPAVLATLLMWVPGLSAVTALVEQVREAGLPVTLRVDGDPGPLDPGVALTVYRIVQEALTNTLKHAGAATTEVRLRLAAGRLTLDVYDTGHGPRPDGTRLGHGLLGMRERVALYGGTLRTGPRPGGGFRVSATIPVDQLGSAAAGG